MMMVFVEQSTITTIFVIVNEKTALKILLQRKKEKKTRGLDQPNLLPRRFRSILRILYGCWSTSCPHQAEADLCVWEFIYKIKWKNTRVNGWFRQTVFDFVRVNCCWRNWVVDGQSELSVCWKRQNKNEHEHERERERDEENIKIYCELQQSFSEFMRLIPQQNSRPPHSTHSLGHSIFFWNFWYYHGFFANLPPEFARKWTNTQAIVVVTVFGRLKRAHRPPASERIIKVINDK